MPPVETTNKKQGTDEEQILIGPRARGRYWRPENDNHKAVSVNTSHLLKKKRIVKCLECALIYFQDLSKIKGRYIQTKF
jgi:hypothetical protein